MFASDEYIGVRPSDNYRFIIFTCPVRGVLHRSGEV